MVINKNIAFLLLISVFQMSGSGDLTQVQKAVNSDDFNKALSLLNNIKSQNLSIHDLALYNYLYAETLTNINKEDEAFEKYLKSRKFYVSIDSVNRAMDINLKIAYLIKAQDKNPTSAYTYLNEYIHYANKAQNNIRLARGYGYLAMFKADEKKYQESLTKYLKAFSYLKVNEDKELESVLNNNIANLYNEHLNKPDSALYYLQKDYKYLREKDAAAEMFYHNYLNQASSYYHKGDYIKANDYLHKADSLPLTKYVLKSKQYLYESFYQNYEALDDYQNAYKYLLLARKFADSTNAEKQNIAINDIQTKYQTKEKELENTKLKSKIETNRILLYSSIGVLIAVAAIAFLIIKNARRKEKISIQEKQIEQQKLEKALKDYELNSIDMMLEGQEKERQRIANDLHDNLGSMLATLKLNFENLKLRKSELRDEENKLYERTDELIEEAYQKVRRLAHAKNAGVFATEGLIPAVRKLAEKISIPGKLQIQVVPFGFSDRLENTLEIAIFRTIQELSTNIIKHSQATEATIHLTNHDDNINIIIEDNGVGFKSSEIQLADGMGLHTIRKKIEQLGGTFTIDSTPGKGTTIIIDIPV